MRGKVKTKKDDMTDKIIIKVKKTDKEAQLPHKIHDTDAMWDVCATGQIERSNHVMQYHTGLAFEPPPGVSLRLYPRSSIMWTSLMMKNSVGVIDNGYRGEVRVVFERSTRDDDTLEEYAPYDRIAQLDVVSDWGLPIDKRKVEFIEVDTVSETVRGTGGFGSTGRK